MILVNKIISRLMDDELPKKMPKANGQLNWTEYHNYADIYAWLDSIQSEFPGFISIEQLGTTYESRPLKLVKLSKQQVLESVENIFNPHQI